MSVVASGPLFFDSVSPNACSPSGAAEVSEGEYKDSWQSAQLGFAVVSNEKGFTQSVVQKVLDYIDDSPHEDRIAHSNLLGACIARMGIIPNITDDANIPITPGLGTVTEDGALIEERARWVAKAVFRSLALVNEWAGRAPAWS